ncbi:pentapeptide repeat-containing protein [Nocardia bovistercoris]|uniref:Pentapeptide repeat-containing protein n=1 Tax=Nocardia bovistercoris TaxID=2785916 RepID=A0A931IGB9_9NOCA|nr:pentapeptide repeat-containing protein [Nocardia bovistercoris]
MPGDLADLPYARFLEPLDGPPEPEGDYDCAHLHALELTDPDIGNARFGESAFTSVTLHGGTLRHSRFRDVWLRDVRWIGTEIADTTWQDVEFVAGALSGVDAGGAVLRRVRFEGCKLDSINLRSAKLHDVVFTDCVLRDVDFAGSHLRTVSFPGSRLEGLLLDKATLTSVDLRGATALDIADGLTALRGATVTPLQLIDLAPAFARATGIVVAEP